MVAHPTSSLAIAQITARNSTTFTDDSKRSLADSRQGRFSEFTATGINAGFAIDFLNTAAAGTVNRCVIPAGHSTSGHDLEIISDNSGVTLPSPSIRSTGTVSGGGVIDRSFAGVSADRYWGLQITTSGAEVFRMAEFWIGQYKSLTLGDGRVDPGFESAYVNEVRTEDFGGRTATLELSPPRRQFSLSVRSLDPAGADYATLEEVVRLGRAAPFWYWPPDSLDAGPYLVRLSSAARRRNDSKIPTHSIRYEVEIDMVEEIT